MDCTKSQPEERPIAQTVVERLSALMDAVDQLLLSFINRHPEFSLNGQIDLGEDTELDAIGDAITATSSKHSGRKIAAIHLSHHVHPSKRKVGDPFA